MHLSFSAWFIPVVLTLLVAVLAVVVTAADTPSSTPLQLPPLPYSDTALEPFISQRTLQIHHGKHHAKYVTTTNSMLAGMEDQLAKTASLEDIILQAHKTQNQGLFNNAAQSWNHAFYWKCMTPGGGGAPPKKGLLEKKLKESFGSYDDFRQQFSAAGNTAFGSGWAWLVFSSSTGTLSVEKTIGAGNPMTSPGSIPILCMDVWEHAYYLDYQNLRPTYVDTFLDKLINWDFVTANLERAMESGRGAEL